VEGMYTLVQYIVAVEGEGEVVATYVEEVSDNFVIVVFYH
jgi:hypothetical protein